MHLPTKHFFLVISVFCTSILFTCSTNSSRQTASSTFQKYFIPKEDIWSSTLGMQIKQNKDESLTDELLLFQSTMELYNQRKYEKVIINFENYFQTNPFNDSFNHQELKFYLAQSYMATGDFSESLKLLEQLSGKMVFKYNSDLGWFKALNLIELNKVDQAKPLLQTLVAMHTKPHFQKAQELLLELK